MKKDVLQKGNEILRIKCTPVENFESARELVTNLIDTIAYLRESYPFARGVGLAAPQIGETIQLSVAERADGQRFILINPEIIETSEEKVPIRDGCLSFHQYRAMVLRHTHVKVRALDLDGKPYEIEADGDFAMLLQHEIDHLNGVLMFDHLPNGEQDLYIP